MKSALFRSLPAQKAQKELRIRALQFKALPHSETARTPETRPLDTRTRVEDTRARLFTYFLLLITLAALVPAMVLALSEFISYDGYWHIFIDKQDRWRIFLSEYRGDAHPMLYHLILRLITVFGHSHLLYRSASIIPGVASIYVLGRIAEKLCQSRVFALLTAAAYGFSITVIGITVDVRSYPLALFFVITACYYLVDFLSRDLDAQAARSLVWCSVCSSLAISSEYYAIFFFLPALGLTLLLLVSRPEMRRGGLEWSIDHWLGLSTAVALPFVVIAFFYQTHIRYQPPTYGHVSEFYWSRGSPLAEFIVRNLRSDLNYMLPVEITSTGGLLILLVAFASLLSYFTYSCLVQNASRRRVAACVPGLLLVSLIGELIALSLAGRYPFGGYDRQQSIYFPFLTLTVFVLLDWLSALLRLRGPRTVIPILAAAAIAFNFYYQWRKMPRRSEELFTAEYNNLRSRIPSTDALYLDQFTLIGFYIHTHDWRWKFEHHFREPDRVDQYDLTNPAGQHSPLLRNIDQWNFDLSKPEIYKILASSLRDSHLPGASIFLLKQVEGHADANGILAEQEQIRTLANEADLEAQVLQDDNTQAEVRFRLEK